MKTTSKLTMLLAATLLLSSCVTRIITTAVAPEPTTTVVYQQPSTRVVYGSTYVQHPTQTTTIIKSSPSKTTTTVVNVTPLGEDISFFLDLRAVGAAFAAANSLEEFEMLLNSSSYMLSSLDLNRDGYVDYLRVVEAVEGFNHVIIIQAVLAQNIFQDVATLTAEMSYSTPYVQIIGAPYIYGPNYYVRPVFVRTPPMFARWRAPHYNPWHSPYYWDYYPHHYHKPAPVYLSHYQAYVNTYITNNKYCNHCEYDDRVHYSDYNRTSSSVTRKDYETRHPEQSFSKRIASAGSASGESRTASISNARDLQKRVASNTQTTTTTGSTSTSRTAATSGNNSGSSSRSSSTSSTSSSNNSSSSSRTSTTSGKSNSSSSRTSNTSGSNTSAPTRKVTPTSTTTTSRVNTSGTSRTTSTTINSDGSSTTTRRGAASSSNSGSSRTSQTSSSSGSSRGSSSSSSSRSSGSGSSSRSGNTSNTNTRR